MKTETRDNLASSQFKYETASKLVEYAEKARAQQGREMPLPVFEKSYARCLADAPGARNHEGKDRSAADFNFCLISIDRGWSVEATANQLMVESEKAKASGFNYALFTAKRAASVVSGNNR